MMLVAVSLGLVGGSGDKVTVERVERTGAQVLVYAVHETAGRGCAAFPVVMYPVTVIEFAATGDPVTSRMRITEGARCDGGTAN